VPAEPFAVAIVSEPEAEAAWVTVGEAAGAEVELELVVLLPQAASSSDAPTAVGRSSFLKVGIGELLSCVLWFRGIDHKDAEGAMTFPGGVGETPT
jgi:hypothetical protein